MHTQCAHSANTWPTIDVPLPALHEAIRALSDTAGAAPSHLCNTWRWLTLEGAVAAFVKAHPQDDPSVPTVGQGPAVQALENQSVHGWSGFWRVGALRPGAVPYRLQCRVDSCGPPTRLGGKAGQLIGLPRARPPHGGRGRGRGQDGGGASRPRPRAQRQYGGRRTTP